MNTEIISIAFFSAVVAYVYCNILIMQGHIFHKFYKWYERKLTVKRERYAMQKESDVPEEVLKMMHDYKPASLKTIVTHEKHWLLKPLGACEYCMTGQIALWAFLVRFIAFKFLSVQVIEIVLLCSWCVCCAFLSILIIHLFKKIL